MSMVCALLLAAIAAIAPHRPLTVPIHARPARAAIATGDDPPRLPSGYRSVRISLRWQAPERAER
ncbi:MAG TPA: hypothetical protein VHW23_24745 [Kofleriaceae bacterium]|nr:hypothetical protein [Kofleriaceae bacterium]